MFEIFRASGGAVYHMRARRRGRLWRSFADDLAVWLDDWQPKCDELVLVGPSGGYTLPDSWLRSWKKITAYDIDPLAGWMFGRCHRLLDCTFHTRDLFWKDSRLATEGVEDVLAAHPTSAILFCNILGQIPLEGKLSEDEWLRYLSDLRRLLLRRNWASYHDIFSLMSLPLSTHATVARVYAQHRDIETALAASTTNANRITVTDHLLRGSWTQGLHKTPMAWSLSPDCLHLIEGVTTSPSDEVQE